MSKFTRRDAIQTICRILPAGALAQWLRAENTTPSLQERLFSVPTVDQDGKISARFAASSRYFPEDLGSGVALEMASVPGGSFNMGAVFAPLIGDSLAQPVHHVSVAPFFLGTYAVTRGQWRRVSTFAKITSDLHAIYPLGMPLDIENQLPIDVVFYYEAIEFCARLQNNTGRPYRLPSEAEW